jgi:hypothetical protein
MGRQRQTQVLGGELGVVLGTVGKSRLKKAFTNAVKAIEARDYGATTAESS